MSFTSEVDGRSPSSSPALDDVVSQASASHLEVAHDRRRRFSDSAIISSEERQRINELVLESGAFPSTPDAEPDDATHLFPAITFGQDEQEAAESEHASTKSKRRSPPIRPSAGSAGQLRSRRISLTELFAGLRSKSSESTSNDSTLNVPRTPSGLRNILSVSQSKTNSSGEQDWRCEECETRLRF